jgi:transcriptional regulator with XRE-family HTH domain
MAEDQALQRRRRGFWLRVAREREGLTLKEVAREMGYALRSQTTIKKWEDGLREPSITQLEHLAEVYRVPVDVFMRPAPTAEEQLEAQIRDSIGGEPGRGSR